MRENGWMTKEELARFARGECCRGYRWLGAHFTRENGADGVRFAVWAPGVRSVRVVGEFTSWQPGECWLRHVSGGVWAGFVPGVAEGALYKYLIETAAGELLYKADPCAFAAELRPGTASRAVKLTGYRWRDGEWMAARKGRDHFREPLNIYEVHLGSWRQHDVPRAGEQDVPPGAFYTYRELADTLVPYAKDMGYTHIELMPVMEHPLDGSWGYQVTGYFAATSRYGGPKDLMYLIDRCHRAGLGVILDWVPGHFCRDSHGLGRFNGEKLYEDQDHVQWGTYTFDFGRGEVRSFLLSSAVFWLERFHADGIRVDGVTSMLYLNYGVDDPARQRRNRNGGEENLEAVEFLRQLNRTVGEQFPGVFTAAEESTAWPMVTKPPEQGGLGFHYKWDMGWMNDTLRYLQTDFPWRPGAHEKLTFSMMYAFSENFILPLSHDEVVHGKCSLIGRQPGDYWRQFAGLRLLALYQMTHPGGKLNFMGNEFGQFIEWRFYEGLEWFLLDYDHHRQHQEFIRQLNRLYRAEPSLWQREHGWDGFEWIDPDDRADSILSYARRGEKDDVTLVVINFRTDSHFGFRLGAPEPGRWREIFNSDEERFGGSGLHYNPGVLRTEEIPANGRAQSLTLTVPPLGGVILRWDGGALEPEPRAEK